MHALTSCISKRRNEEDVLEIQRLAELTSRRDSAVIASFKVTKMTRVKKEGQRTTETQTSHCQRNCDPIRGEGFPFCEVLWITLHVMDILWMTLELINILWITLDLEISCSPENESEIPTTFCKKNKSLFNHYLGPHSFSLLLCSKVWSEEDQTPSWPLLTPFYFHKGPSGSQAPGSRNRHHVGGIYRI